MMMSAEHLGDLSADRLTSVMERQDAAIEQDGCENKDADSAAENPGRRDDFPHSEHARQ